MVGKGHPEGGRSGVRYNDVASKNSVMPHGPKQPTRLEWKEQRAIEQSINIRVLRSFQF